MIVFMYVVMAISIVLGGICFGYFMGIVGDTARMERGRPEPMSRSQLTQPLEDLRLRSAAESVIKSCGPALARISRSLLDSDQARELDHAKQSLLDLAKALEVSRAV